MKVVLSIAHTHYAPGASNGIDDEFRLSKELCKEIAKIAPYDCVVIESDRLPYGKSLQHKVSQVNSIMPDLACEIHLNAAENPSANGMEVLYYHRSKNGKAVASTVLDTMKSKLPFKTRGVVPRSDIYFLSRTRCVAILIEVCFITSSSDMNMFMDHKAAIVKSINDGTIKAKEVLCPRGMMSLNKPVSCWQKVKGAVCGKK